MQQQKAFIDNMLNGQIRTGDVQDEAIIHALSAVGREAFVPEAFKHAAYVDEEISLGQGRVLMEPLAFARMLKYAAIGKQETVLDVGCGTGYSSAVLSHLAQKVVALEEDAMLGVKAKMLLAAYANVKLIQSDLAHGASSQSPYDVILIGGAIQTLPQVLCDQLCEGGRLLTIEHIAHARAGSAGLGKLVEYRKIRNQVYKTVLHDASAPLIPAFKKPIGFVF